MNSRFKDLLSLFRGIGIFFVLMTVYGLYAFGFPRYIYTPGDLFNLFLRFSWYSSFPSFTLLAVPFTTAVLARYAIRGWSLYKSVLMSLICFLVDLLIFLLQRLLIYERYVDKDRQSAYDFFFTAGDGFLLYCSGIAIAFVSAALAGNLLSWLLTHCRLEVKISSSATEK